ncbi:MAG: hypothetical protein IJH43_07625 [Mogibacterium sp.]|nr:hypothetical protein [Mogibacterium sp.]
MRYYNKEWYALMQFLGTTDMFEPVIDKEYTDEEMDALYREMREKYIQEEHDLYDEPPCLDIDEWKEEFPEEDFDPDDYLIADIDEEGEEINYRNPETYEDLVQFQIDEYEFQWKEFENRPPFNEEEAGEEFDENYNDSLEEPDEDIPAWILETVDPRLVALGLLPESAYKKLLAEEEEKQNRFDEMDEIADREYESMIEEIMEGIPEAVKELPDGTDYDDAVRICEDLNEVDGDYVLEIRKENGDIAIVFSGWNEDGDELIRTGNFENVEILEDEGVVINAERDEDGDVISDCDFTAHEIYFSKDGYEVHLMFDNNGLKYLTFKCTYITFEQECVTGDGSF